MNPALATLVGYVGLDERMSALQVWGAAVILAGVLMINWPRAARAPAPVSPAATPGPPAESPQFLARGLHVLVIRVQPVELVPVTATHTHHHRPRSVTVGLRSAPSDRLAVALSLR